jgi:hydrogenase expression/formation protein HypD
MRFIEEYRDAEAAQRFADAIRKTVTRDWTVMEVCGGTNARHHEVRHR